MRLLRTGMSRLVSFTYKFNACHLHGVTRTLISHSGNLVHIGQLFFDDAFSDQVLALEPYTTNTNDRTLNEDDGILQEQNSDGNNAFLDLELLGESLQDGVLGYISKRFALSDCAFPC
jgi:hypothetical protein